MKIQSLAFSVVALSFGFAAQALPITATAEVPSMTAKELLTLPEKNRHILAQVQKKNESFLTDLQNLAFNKDESFQIRWKALTLFSKLKGQQAQEHVLKACAADEWFMKNACLVILGTSSPSLGKAKAKEFLNNKALVVRSQAVRSLSVKMDGAGRDLLWEELDKPVNYHAKQSLWIRGQIVEALSSHPEKQELLLFAKALRDKDSRLHFYAIRALESISGKKMGLAKSSVADQRDLWLKNLK